MPFLGRVPANEQRSLARRWPFRRPPVPLPHIKHTQGLWPFFTFLLNPDWGSVKLLSKQQVVRPSPTTCGGPALLGPGHMPVGGHVALPVVAMALVNMSTGFRRSILNTIQSTHVGAQDGAGAGQPGHHMPAELLAQEALNTRQH